MIRFNNDYNRSAHPEVLEALMKSSGESYGSYGLDFWCEKAARRSGNTSERKKRIFIFWWEGRRSILR